MYIFALYFRQVNCCTLLLFPLTNDSIIIIGDKTTEVGRTSPFTISIRINPILHNVITAINRVITYKKKDYNGLLLKIK